MLKWFRRIILFLLLGAIVNVAVAWGCCAAVEWFNRCRLTWCVDPRLEDSSPLEFTHGFGYERVTSSTYTLGLIAAIRGHEPQPRDYRGVIWWPQGGLQNPRTTHVASGWPMRAVRAWETTSVVITTSAAPPQTPSKDFVHWGIVLDEGEGKGSGLILPLRPITVAMVVNSTLYSLLLGAMVIGQRAIRSGFRRCRAQCPACGYPRGTSPLCTECGAPLPVVAKPDPAQPLESPPC